MLTKLERFRELRIGDSLALDQATRVDVGANDDERSDDGRSDNLM